MKAISIHQPWASLIAQEHKTIETRTWNTQHRGPLVICSSKTIQEDICELYEMPDPPRGLALCVANLVDCRRMTEEDEVGAMRKVFYGAYAWILEDVKPIQPFKVRGFPGLFFIKDELVKICQTSDES